MARSTRVSGISSNCSELRYSSTACGNESSISRNWPISRKQNAMSLSFAVAICSGSPEARTVCASATRLLSSAAKSDADSWAADFLAGEDCCWEAASADPAATPMARRIADADFDSNLRYTTKQRDAPIALDSALCRHSKRNRRSLHLAITSPAEKFKC